MDKITTDQKKLHEKYQDMYSPKHFIWVMKFNTGRACGKHRRNRYSCWFLVGQPSWKELTGKVYV